MAQFWSGRRVLLTGHTGFKGAWLSLWLEMLGAEVFGLALAPATEPSLFSLTRQAVYPQSAMVDLRDRASVGAFVEAARPQIVIHMAAQALVRESYRDPLGTFATNVLGTANLLDALRGSRDLEAVLVVTTDKVYENDEKGRAFVETDRLGGKDPYSGSKACTEIVVGFHARQLLPPWTADCDGTCWQRYRRRRLVHRPDRPRRGPRRDGRKVARIALSRRNQALAARDRASVRLLDLCRSPCDGAHARTRPQFRS